MPLLRIGSTPHGAEIEARVWVEGDLEAVLTATGDTDDWPDMWGARGAIENTRRKRARERKQNGRG